MKVRGDHLSQRLQNQVKAKFIHRFTGDNKPAWADTLRPDGTPYPLQFRDDNDWLANTYFEVTKQGELDRRTKYCESYPTWPEGNK